MTTIAPTALEIRTAVESCLLIYLILEPCQQLAARRVGDDELAAIIEQLRAAMTQAVADLPVSAQELAAPIGTHAVEILRPLDGKPTVLRLLSVLYLVRDLVAVDKFVLQAETTLDLATTRLISLIERNYSSSWDKHEKQARRWARALHTQLLKRGLFGGQANRTPAAVAPADAISETT